MHPGINNETNGVPPYIVNMVNSLHPLSPCPTHITHFPTHSMLKGGNNNNSENHSTTAITNKGVQPAY